MAATLRSRPIPARTGLPMNPTALPRQRDHLNHMAGDMAGKMDPLARILHPPAAYMAALGEARARMARPMRRHWASLSPPG
jgi:hypothetical protein